MNALVVGGGIAGIASALALQKAGFEPQVFEAYGRSADGVGAFLTLAVNGLEALAAIDVDPAALGGFETPTMELYLGDGRRLTSFSFGAEPGRPAPRTIGRAELYSALRREAERRGIAIAYGKALEDAETDEAGVVARFADGSTARGDVLIGADGLRSRVRALVDARAPRARYVGLLNTGGYARGVSVDGAPGTMRFYFGKRCFFGYVPHPNGEVWWFANPARSKEPTREELAAITPAAWRTELRDLFADDAFPARAIIDATPDVATGWATYDFPTVPVWHRDRMIIVGDAAHAASPSSGQGASMAIEDAVVLAKCFRDAPDVSSAFARYEATRRPRVERVVREGKKSGDGKTPGRFGRVFRDAVLRVIFSGERQRDPWAFLLRDKLEWASPA
jgi:2-polyprenyl-6-methoxyphenol hydroxylase-like FAD-dependent oxidoreductase